MKRVLLIALFFITGVTASAQLFTSIPDPAFEQELINLGIDSPGPNGSVISASIRSVTTLSINNPAINDLTGIEGFQNLTTLVISNTSISSLDVSTLENLTDVVLTNNSNLSSLSLGDDDLDLTVNSNSGSLTLLVDLFKINHTIRLFGNQSVAFISSLASLTLTPYNITSVSVSSNTLRNLNLSSIPDLNNIDLVIPNIETLDISNTSISSLNTTALMNLTSLDVSNTSVSSLNTTTLMNLTSLDISDTRISNLDISSSPNLNVLDVSSNTSLSTLNIQNTSLSLIDLSTNASLTDVILNNNLNMSSLSLIDDNLNLTANNNSGSLTLSVDLLNTSHTINLNGNRFVRFTSSLPSLTLTSDTITRVNVSSNTLRDLDLSGIPNLNSLNLSFSLKFNLETLDISNTGISFFDTSNLWNLTSLDVSNTGISFLDTFDLSSLTSLDVSNTSISFFYIYSPNLNVLDVSSNTSLSTLYIQNSNLSLLDLSTNTSLTDVTLNNNLSLNSIALINDDLNLTVNDVPLLLVDLLNTNHTINFTGNSSLAFTSSLASLKITSNTITSGFVFSSTLLDLDLSGIPNLNNINLSTVNLENLDISNTSVSTLNTTTLMNLTSLDVSNTSISNLDISNSSNLNFLDVSSNANLLTLNASNTSLTSLGLSSNTSLVSLNLSDNPNITELNLQNGSNTNISGANFISMNTPNLSCILVDDVAFSNINWTNKDAANSFSTDCGFANDFIYENSAWTPNDPSDLSNPAGFNDNVIIRDDVTISSDFRAENLIIETGNILTLSNLELITNGIVTNNGMLNAASSSVVAFGGSNTWSMGQSTIGILELANANLTLSGTVSITDAIYNNDTISTSTLNTTGSTVTLSSDVNGYAIVSGAQLTINGDVVIENYFPDRRAFELLSVPLTTTTTIFQNWQENGASSMGLGTHITGSAGSAGGFDVTGTNNSSMYSWDMINQTWDAQLSTNGSSDTFNAGDFYRLLIRGDRMVDLTSSTSSSSTKLRTTGQVLNTDFINTGISLSAGDFVSVTNPYQNTYELSTAMTGLFNLASTDINAVDPNFYFIWDSQAGTRGAYRTYDRQTNTLIGPASVNSRFVPGVLAPSQSAFMVSSGEANANLIVRKPDNSITPPGFIMNQTLDGKLSLQLFTVDSSNQEIPLDAILVKYLTTGVNAVDDNDAVKFSNIDETLSVNIQSDYLSIESRAMPQATDMTPLTLTTYRHANYIFKAQPTDLVAVDAYLVDNYMGTTTMLSSTSETAYSFTVDASNADSIAQDRFHIIYQNSTLSTGSEELAGLIEIYPNPVIDRIVYINMNGLTGEKEIKLYTILGQMITNKDSNTTTVEQLDLSNLAPAVYIMEINNEGTKFTQKLIVK